MLLSKCQQAWRQGVAESSFNLTATAGSENSCMRMKAELLYTIVRVGGQHTFQRKKLKRWMPWHVCFHFVDVRDIRGTTPLD